VCLLELLRYPGLATPRFPANRLRIMSAILSADDLNDFISPGVACIKPIETLPVQQEETSVCSLLVLSHDWAHANLLECLRSHHGREGRCLATATTRFDIADRLSRLLRMRDERGGRIGLITIAH
jgi:hypothetical protein